MTESAIRKGPHVSNRKQSPSTKKLVFKTVAFGFSVTLQLQPKIVSWKKVKKRRRRKTCHWFL